MYLMQFFILSPNVRILNKVSIIETLNSLEVVGVQFLERAALMDPCKSCSLPCIVISPTVHEMHIRILFVTV
ncbi:hypothetical protein L9F63_008249, partial [Diploptera punctata]